MEKQAVCIQCHKNPDYINELIELFPREKFDIFIHMDKKSGVIIPDIIHGDHIHFVPEEKRIDVGWGRFSQVEATLAMMDMFTPEEYGYVHLISGEDAPVKSPNEIYEFLAKDDKEYIQSFPILPTKGWRDNWQSRYLVRYPAWMVDRRTNTVKRTIRIFYREFVLRTGIGKRKDLPAATIFGGSQWFSLTGKCVQWIMEYIHTHEEFMTFFHSALCPDEMVFNTIVRYSPFAEHIANTPARFMIWEGSKTGGPLTLKREQISLMRGEDHNFFARKVSDVDTLRAIKDEIWK